MSMTPEMQADLQALGIAPEMLGPAEHLPMPASGPHAALQVSPTAASLLLPAHSPSMDALGLRVEVDPAGLRLHVISRNAIAFQVRPGLRTTQAQAADEAGISRVT